MELRLIPHIRRIYRRRIFTFFKRLSRFREEETFGNRANLEDVQESINPKMPDFYQNGTKEVETCFTEECAEPSDCCFDENVGYQRICVDFKVMLKFGRFICYNLA